MPTAASRLYIRKLIFVLLVLLLALLIPLKLHGQEQQQEQFTTEPPQPLAALPDPLVVEQLAAEWKEAEKQKMAATARLVRQQQQRAVRTPKAAVKPKIGSYDPCSCVSYARWVSGINVGTIGLAKRHPINSKTPAVGGLAIYWDGWAGHLVYVAAINGSMMTIKESNYTPCKVGQRTVPISSADGFYNP